MEEAPRPYGNGDGWNISVPISDAYAELIAFELPEYKVQAAGEILKFQNPNK